MLESLLNENTAYFAVMIVYMMGAGLIAGFAAGVFGIGGGFVVVPALFVIFAALGVDLSVIPHLAVGTSLATIIATSLRSVLAHAKKGAVDFDVLKTWAPWIVAGVILGLVLADSVDGRTLTIIFAVGVFIMGLYMMFGRTGTMKISDNMPTGPLRAGLASFVGAFSSLLGIGGGTFAILVMTLFGKSMHQAVATAAGFGFIIAIPGAIGFAIIGMGEENLPFGSLGYVNLVAFSAMTGMSILTAPLGVRAAHALNPDFLRRVFAGYLIFTTALMFRESLGPDTSGREALKAPSEVMETQSADGRSYSGFSGAPPEEGLAGFD